MDKANCHALKVEIFESKSVENNKILKQSMSKYKS